MKKSTILILGMIFLTGCISTHEQMNDLSLGMSRQEVLAKMGEPDDIKDDGVKELLTYKLSVDDGTGTEEKKDYWVELKEGRVIDYGRGWRLLDQ
jgi:hypothetical protein